ncbi:MAG: YbjN domain-containing protein [bacterium]|nr:YbjN domain-containing protein [bacterium]
MGKTLEDLIDYAHRMGLQINKTDLDESLIVVAAEHRGISNLVIDCEDSIVILEQPLYRIRNQNAEHFKRLLTINRELVHGAFVMDPAGDWILFRDTLELENLDFNEFEGSVNALTLGLAEFSRELLNLNAT